MAKNLRVFQTLNDYNEAELVLPSVSYVVDNDKVVYDPYTPPTPTFQGKWKATYTDSSVSSAECDASSEIVYDEIPNIFNLVEVEIGNCVTSIGDNVFHWCTRLTSCTIGSSVTSISNAAFSSCSSLSSVTIPNSVTSIGIQTFMACTSLTSCTIGSSVTSIGTQAFGNCESLTNITIEATTPPTLYPSAFDNTNNSPIYVPSASVDAYKTAWSSYSSRIQAIPNS